MVEHLPARQKDVGSNPTVRSTLEGGGAYANVIRCTKLFYL